MLKKVSVSLIVTCCNLEKYLDETMRSIADQTLPPTEVIVVHDGCTLPAAFANTTLLHFPRNKGVSQARNYGFQIAQGDYVLFLDGDDVLAENFVEIALRTATETSADVVYPNVLLWSHWGTEAPQQNKWMPTPSQIDHQALFDRCPIVVTSLIKRTAFLGFQELSLYEDWQMWIRMLIAGKTFERADTFLKYRQRQNSRNRGSEELRNEVYHQVRDKYEVVEGKLRAKS